MRKNFGPKTWLYPMPVLMIGTWNEDGTPDLMNAAWGGIYDTNKICICLGEHRTTDNILAKKAFTVSPGTVETAVACDYVGIVSCNDVPDKVARAGFHAVKSEFVDAPLFEELPMALECRFISRDEESGEVVGEIVNISADERILREDGKICTGLLRPISYDPVRHFYLEVGAKAGDAFSDGKKLI